eukprot:COSAG04_NODE_17977_length_454_cov_0.980282_1_plen_113_part_01
MRPHLRACPNLCRGLIGPKRRRWHEELPLVRGETARAEVLVVVGVVVHRAPCTAKEKPAGPKPRQERESNQDLVSMRKGPRTDCEKRLLRKGLEKGLEVRTGDGVGAVLVCSQ